MPLWQVAITSFLSALIAGSAVAYLARASLSSRERKRISELETEVATLHSELARVLQLSKKISQRVALDQHRHKSPRSTRVDERDDPPPQGDKAAAKAYYLRGRSHAEVARLAMRGGSDGE
jgi:hypothetical protein